MKKKKSNKEWILPLVGISLLAICGVLSEWWDDDTEKNTVESSVSDSFSSSSKNGEEKNTFSGSNSSVQSYQSYRDAIKKLDFEAAHDSLNILREQFIDKLDDPWWREYEYKYYEAFDYIYKAEVQYLISEIKGEDCKDRITFLLEEIPSVGNKITEGLCDYFVTVEGQGDNKNLHVYMVWTQHYNRLCNSILNLAINRKNQDLAKQILLLYVDNVNVTQGDSYTNIVVDGIKVDGNHGYIKYTSEDRDAAQKKYDKAVELGAFN